MLVGLLSTLKGQVEGSSSYTLLCVAVCCSVSSYTLLSASFHSIRSAVLQNLCALIRITLDSNYF